MSTGSIVVVVGGVAVVGGALYLLTRKPLTPTTVVGRPAPAGSAATVGSSALALLTGLGGGLVNIFAGSKSQGTTTSQLIGQPIAQGGLPGGWSATDYATAYGDQVQGNTLLDSSGDVLDYGPF